ncbi:MAG: Gfo/Idh/MocA family protein [Acidimicrobiia bacterium]
MRPTPFCVGIIGFGNVAQRHHLTGLRAQPDDVRVVAVAEPVPALRELAKELLGLDDPDVHESPIELLARPDVDVVDVCVPPQARRDIVVAAAEAGKHIIAEKPLAAIPKEAEEMVEAARRAGVMLAMAHNYVFFPEFQAARAVIEAGELGRIEVVTLDYLGVEDRPGSPLYRPRWRHDAREAGGGVLMDMLHPVYLAEFLLGRPVERVSAYVTGRAPEASVEDLALCRLETAANVALVNVGWGVGPGGAQVSGTEGFLKIRYQEGRSMPFYPLEEVELVRADGRRRLDVAMGGSSHAGVFADLAQALREGRPPFATGQDGLRVLETVMAVYESGVLQRTIRVPLDRTDPLYLFGLAGLSQMAQSAG